MTVFYLPAECIAFPDPDLADADGLLAVGGDLSLPRLLAAYARGIFPWYGPQSPILWWSPHPRLVLEPAQLHIPKSLRRVLNKGRYRITLDQACEQVIHNCAISIRPQGAGTWLVREMIEAYTRLHQAGFVHSVEAWLNDRLVGGFYGLALGRAFFGESMFFSEPDASKVAFVRFVKTLRAWGFTLVDCQQTTRHMLRFGSVELPRPVFLERLQEALVEPLPKQGKAGTWLGKPVLPWIVPPARTS